MSARLKLSGSGRLTFNDAKLQNGLWINSPGKHVQVSTVFFVVLIAYHNFRQDFTGRGPLVFCGVVC